MNVRDSVYSVHQKTPKYLKTLWCCHANKSRVIPSESHTPCVVVLMYVLIRGCVEINRTIRTEHEICTKYVCDYVYIITIPCSL